MNTMSQIYRAINELWFEIGKAEELPYFLAGILESGGWMKYVTKRINEKLDKLGLRVKNLEQVI